MPPDPYILISSYINYNVEEHLCNNFDITVGFRPLKGRKSLIQSKGKRIISYTKKKKVF